MTSERPKTDKAASLKARAERCRNLAKMASSPFAARMLEGLAQQLEGEAERASLLPGPAPLGPDPVGHAA